MAVGQQSSGAQRGITALGQEVETGVITTVPLFLLWHLLFFDKDSAANVAGPGTQFGPAACVYLDPLHWLRHPLRYRARSGCRHQARRPAASPPLRVREYRRPAVRRQDRKSTRLN